MNNMFNNQRLSQILYLNRLMFLRPYEKIFILQNYMKSHTQDASNKFFEKMAGFNANNWRNFLGRSLKKVNFSLYEHRSIIQGVVDDLQWLRSRRGKIISIENPYYPSILREISAPPLLLYARGNVEILNQPAISIVGTRNPSKAGIEVSHSIGYQLSQKNIHVVSGFAIGIDIAAHRGLNAYISHQINDYIEKFHVGKNTSISILSRMPKNYGRPIVVLGTNIDVIYPKVHKNFAQDILSYGGVFLSEIPINAKCGKHSFIARNRIISGLSMHTIVVQAPKKSGALATADFAIEQGRNVWVHRVGTSDEYEGTKNLWQSGAEVFDKVEEIR